MLVGLGVDRVACILVDNIALTKILETTRDPREYDYNPLFDYIDNQMIQKDKLVRERVLLEIVQTINVDFLNLQKAKGSE